MDKNSFAFLFNEEIYVIPEKGSESVKEAVEVEPIKDKPKVEIKAEPLKKVEAEKKIPSIPKIPVTNIATKEYAILVNSPQELEAGKEFLGKILGAIKLDFNKVDTFTSEAASDPVLAKNEYKVIISFGLDAGKHQQVLNKVVKKGNNSILFSNTLSELQKDIEKKKALWAAMQQLV